MIEKIIFSVIAFILFTYVFMFKLVKKNDTSYIIILTLQAIGITVHFFQILLGIENNIFARVIAYILCFIIPILLIYLEEKRKISFYEAICIIKAKYYYLLGDKEKAKQVFVDLVSKYKDSYIGHKKMAEIYEQNGETKKAIDEYVKLVDINKQDYNSYFKISSLLKEIGKKEESMSMLKNLLKEKPDYYEATELLGDLLCEKEQYREAIILYTDAMKYHPDKYEIYYNLGIVYTMLNDFKTAKDYYEKAAKINTKLYNAYYSLGQIALLYKELEEAEGYFIKSLYEETEANSYYQLSKIYLLKHEKEKAINFINKALEIEPSYIEKVKKESLFLTIKQHIVVPEGQAMANQTKKTQKEKALELHLDNTYVLINQLRMSKEDNKSKYKENENQKERS